MRLPYELTQEEYLIEPCSTVNTEDRSSFSVLMDVWGEANHAMEIPIEDKKSLKMQLNSLHDICCLIYGNPNYDQGLKDELRISEWELNDFLLGENSLGYSKEGIMSWFDQWCYKINYNFL